MKTIVRCLLAALLAAPLTANAQERADEPADAVLNPGDALRITVWRRPELSGDFSVAADSSIVHPLFRRIKVAGVPMVVVEERVREYLRGLESDPQFVLQPLFRVAIGGEVRQPNLYSFAPGVTLAQAVALAGGPTDRGRLDRVRLRRHGQEIVIDLTDPDQPLAQTSVRSGDQVLVGRRTSIFRDYIAPAASITAAFGTVINLLLR